MTDTELKPFRRWVKRAVVLACLVVLPYLVHQVYVSWTGLPAEIRIATGTVGGRYRAVADALGEEIALRSGATVEMIETQGSIENLELLERGELELALFQPEAVGDDSGDHSKIRSAGNVFSEVVVVLARRESGIESVFDLRGKHVSIGVKESGDRATATLVLSHCGLSVDEIEPEAFDYAAIEQGFRDATLDAAMVTVGLDAEFLRTISQDGLAGVVEVPYAQALAAKHLGTQRIEIPAGSFCTSPVAVPARSVATVAVRSQLLTTDDVPDSLVELVDEILMDQRFQRGNRLRELFSGGGETFATMRTLFPLHEGAVHFFEPELKPLLSADFVEATEGLRSFVVSMLFAGWLVWRWLRENRIRQQEHRLDRFIRQLLEIERRQMDLDQTSSGDDASKLNDLLDEVTTLRQEALSTLTSHELHDDPAAGVFIEMCHALSDKINAKLNRQRLDSQFQALIAQWAGTSKE
ncbi:MAG: TAXI family TRAP transporter solute-binding subunit [Planctomycetales bacterium]